MPIKEMLKEVPEKERAEIKAREYMKIDHTGIFQVGDMLIELLSFDKIKDGIEVYAKVFEKGLPLGFGADGTVEIERFRFINPPMLAHDGTFTFIPAGTDPDILFDRNTSNFVVNPKQALIATLAHSISLAKKDGKNIVRGKIGTTTTTVFCTGWEMLQGNLAGQTWSALYNKTGETVATGGTNYYTGYVRSDTTSNTFDLIRRAAWIYDTSAVGTDTISSATLSLYADGVSDTYAAGATAIIDKPTAVSNNASDYNIGNWASVAQSNTQPIIASGISTVAYTDFALNATGIGNITKSASTYFGWRQSNDFNNSAPTWASGNISTAGFYTQAEAGTSKDPKLVMVHAPAETGMTYLNNGAIAIPNRFMRQPSVRVTK